jgi:carrier protein
VLQSILEIYREQGIWGFFAGIAPRWLGEIVSLVLASTVVFAVTSYCIQDNEMKSYSTPAIQVMENSLLAY